MKRQRRQDRNLCADLVQVGWMLDDESRHTEWATLEDISPAGACVKLDDSIPSDSLVSLRFPRHICEARVKYCVADRDGYLVGMEFAGGYRWSRGKYKPQHLLQFRLRPVPRQG